MTNRFQSNPDYQKLINEGRREEQVILASNGVAVSQDCLSEDTAMDQLQIYIRWRAMGKVWKEAARLSKISEEDARLIEKADDIIEQILSERDKIMSDPKSAILDIVPMAIGLLREKVQEGNLGAAQEVLKNAMSDAKKSGVDKEDATSRSSATLDERDAIQTKGRKVISRYRPAGSDNTATGSQPD